MDKIQEVIPEDKQPELLESFTKGNISLRVMKEMFESMLEMGPMSQMMSMIPGFNMDALTGGQNDAQGKIMFKRYITIMESMTEKELDTVNIKDIHQPSRIMRLARGAGRPPGEVNALFEQFKAYGKMASTAMKAMPQMKNMKNMNQNMQMNPRQMQQAMAGMSKAIPANVLQQMGGMGGLQNLMKSLDGKGMGGLAGLGGPGGGKGKK